MNSFSLKKILVPVDMSETSLCALEAAAAIALKNNSEIIILNVVEDFLPLQADNPLLFSSTNADVLSALAKSVGERTNVEQRDGHVMDAIIATSIEKECDLIVMGTHGASGSRDGFIGSNSYSVMKYSRCPVLTIPKRKRAELFRKPLFPIRPQPGALNAYDVLLHFLGSNPTLDVLGLSGIHLEKETRLLHKVVEEINPQLESGKVKVNISWGITGQVADDILHFAQSSGSDLIVITSLVDAITKANFIGPHAQKLVHHAKVPVLSIKKIGVPAFA